MSFCIAMNEVWRKWLRPVGRTWWLAWILGAVVGAVGPGGRGWAAEATATGARVLYETRFEAVEGFDPALTLLGQGGWVGSGSGGNGLTRDFFAGQGQHAFLGFGAPTNNDGFVSVWRPLNYVPNATNPPVVRFQVQMSIEDSQSTTNRDDFRWSVYNIRGDRLLSLDFDNDSLAIHHILDDNQVVVTGASFTNSQPYQLEIVLNFAKNRWSSSLDGAVLTTNLPITTVGAPLDLGDFDAVWAIRQPGRGGDNYLVFDNLRIVSEAEGTPVPPRLAPLGLLRPGGFLLRCFGTPGTSYIIEGATAPSAWTGLKTNTMPVDGQFEYLDPTTLPWRFYRMRER